MGQSSGTGDVHRALETPGDSRANLARFFRQLQLVTSHGDNISLFIRSWSSENQQASHVSDSFETLVSYDRQAGSYVRRCEEDPDSNRKWTQQVSEYLNEVIPRAGSLLEVGVGEATTLAGVIPLLKHKPLQIFGFDLSWSRLRVAQNWAESHGVKTEFFVGDLKSIPLATNSVDVVYSSHSLEPNRGFEIQIIKECLRVAKTALVLFEPRYEMANSDQKARMDRFGYVQNLTEAASQVGGGVVLDELLPFSPNPENPSGVLVIRKEQDPEPLGSKKGPRERKEFPYVCPLTLLPVTQNAHGYFVPEAGLLYPVIAGIPLLRPEHAIVASLGGQDA